jgi:hypothetical protein
MLTNKQKSGFDTLTVEELSDDLCHCAEEKLKSAFDPESSDRPKKVCLIP